MRRSEREVTDCNEIRQILERAEVLRLAMHDEPFPYICLLYTSDAADE